MAQAAGAIETHGATARTGPKRPIDLVHLAKQCLGDANLELEILAMFDKTIASYLDRLETATTIEALQTNLHTIRGASAGVGAFTVADHARTAERELAAGGPVNPERIQDIAMAIEEVRSYISDVLKAADWSEV